MLIKRNFLIFLSISTLLFFTSCIKYHKLSKEETPQGRNLPDYRHVVYDNLRSKTIYNEFSTLAHFDVLRLSDEVREAYVNINADKRGKDKQAKKAMLRRQLEENKHWISMYILADIRDKNHVSLTDKNSLWSPFIVLSDGRKVMPISIKEVDLEPEYQFLFGYRFNVFKRSYEVKFPVANAQGENYLRDDITYTLIMSSPAKQVEYDWSRPQDFYMEGKRDIRDDDYYWI
ncbi:hypothetical protein GF322_02050 [Candidatus Dependentiae bacterium]|nr:hypothetical protein [Candidatus Dependentiae bacterium]